MLLAAHVAEVLIDVRVRPVPRHLVGEVEEAANDPLTVVDRVQAEVARQLLPSPACEHLLEDLIGRVQVPDTAERDDATEIVDRHESPNDATVS